MKKIVLDTLVITHLGYAIYGARKERRNNDVLCIRVLCISGVTWATIGDHHAPIGKSFHH